MDVPATAVPAVDVPNETLREPFPFIFTGSGREYFRIWIVNLLLSIITLGVYSAWAKVRRLQYFYRSTHLAGASFDYHGSPLALLRGRLVAVALLALYYVARFVSPIFGLAAIALLALVLPWLLARSFRFRFYNSSYRGLRFLFSGSTRSAYWVFLGLPVLSVLTLFTLWPLWHHRMKRYQHAHAAYGRTRFSYDAPVSEFYPLLITWYVGDVSTVVAAAPTTLLQAKYSRDFEREADAFAAETLRGSGIAPSFLADLLERLESARPHTGASVGAVRMDYLSTHPATAERLAQLRAR